MVNHRKEDRKLEEYLIDISERIIRLEWGRITIDIQNGLPVRIVEERSIKLQ